MLLIDNIAGAITQIFRVWGNKTDGDNVQKLDIVKQYRDTDKAMEAAEKFFFSATSYLDGKIERRQFKVLYNKYFKLFFKYN